MSAVHEALGLCVASLWAYCELCDGDWDGDDDWCEGDGEGGVPCDTWEVGVDEDEDGDADVGEEVVVDNVVGMENQL